MDEKFDGRMIFLLIIAVFLGITFYHIIEEQERPQTKITVARLLRTHFFKHKAEFEKLAGAADKVSTYSNDWYLERSPENKIAYYSETSFDSCRIPLSEYQKKFYGKTDRNALPCYIPDFAVPEFINVNEFDSLEISKVWYQREEMCRKPVISFIYKEEAFSPKGRTIKYRYFPNGLCKEMIDEMKKPENLWNWIIFIDKNWIAESVKHNHI
jgi:hypothetical protein